MIRQVRPIPIVLPGGSMFYDQAITQNLTLETAVSWWRDATSPWGQMLGWSRFIQMKCG